MHSEIHGDRAIRHSSDDCLGFTPLAKQIAKSIVDRTVDDGFVIGIEGAWGSGKSSLINLIVDQ